MEGSTSLTALMAAVQRGRHRLEDPLPWIMDDPFALVLVGPRWPDLAAASRSRFSDELGRQIRASIAVRSRYAEHRLVGGSFDQFVLLGAGLDSFAWRRPDLMGPLRLFEVDHPASQAWKRGRAAELGLPDNQHHVFAPVDFEVQSLRDGLDDAGFDWSRPTMFSWLGVVPYLTAGAVEATLRTIATCRTGSEVVFEYGLDRDHMDDMAREFSAGFSSVATRIGEPLHGGWPPSEAEAAVSRSELRVADHPAQPDLVERYFSGRSDGLQPWHASRLMAATVP
jgi:methyltransferase (TIGR00027 family)